MYCQMSVSLQPKIYKNEFFKMQMKTRRIAHLMTLVAISTTISAQNVATDSVDQQRNQNSPLVGMEKLLLVVIFTAIINIVTHEKMLIRMLQVMDVSTFRMQLSILVTTLERAGAWEQKSNSNTQAQVLPLK